MPRRWARRGPWPRSLFLLGPVLQRWSTVGDVVTGDRVLATLDDVELVAVRDPGEMLVVTERPRAGERLVLRRRP